MALRQVSKIALRDGRTLAWREYGAGTSGTPIVFLHGYEVALSTIDCYGVSHLHSVALFRTFLNLKL